MNTNNNFLKELVQCLYGFTVDRCGNNSPSHVGYLTRVADGLSLRFGFDEHGSRGKITISGSSGDLNNGVYIEVYDENYARVRYPSINVSMSKDVRKVAIDIGNRLLGECNRVHLLVLKKIAEDNKFKNDRDHSTRYLANTCGVMVSKNHRHPNQLSYDVDPFGTTEKYKKHGYGKFTVNSGDSVNLELNSMSFETATKVAAALRLILQS
jgi:hypothetical protein